MIHTTKSKIHWNYFVALEQDLEVVSRYVEFSEHNFSVYSIELARLLFAAASEVDVMAKLLCKRFQPTANPDNINAYRDILLAELPDLPTMEIFITRYGLSFKPWENWSQSSVNSNPIWWNSYNKVKHQRDIHFDKATLKNALNALGALLILIYYYYSYELANNEERLDPKETMRQLEPESTLLKLPENYYHGHLLI